MKCGTDICNVDRIKKAIEEHGDAFLKRIFTEKEIEYCEKYKVTRYEKYAARFAAKEAVYKAISPKKDQGGVFTEVEIVNEETGKPRVELHGELAIIADKELIDISMSHEKEYAVAVCVVSDE